MNNKLLNNLEIDINLLIKDDFGSKNKDLMRIAIGEEVLELIKFARKVNNVLDHNIGSVTGDYMSGYKDGINQVKKEIYD